MRATQMGLCGMYVVRSRPQSILTCSADRGVVYRTFLEQAPRLRVLPLTQEVLCSAAIECRFSRSKFFGGFMNVIMKRVRFLEWFIFTAALLALFSGMLQAQEATGRIVGVVYDPSGAVLPGVHVVVTNT